MKFTNLNKVHRHTLSYITTLYHKLLFQTEYFNCYVSPSINILKFEKGWTNI